MSNPFRANQLMRVRDMRDIPQESRAQASPRVLELSVRDLEDLALKLSGVPTTNRVIDELTFEDMRSLEDVFQAYKASKFEALSGPENIGAIEELAKICDSTCCCCTPCCTCAAAEVDPIEH